MHILNVLTPSGALSPRSSRAARTAAGTLTARLAAVPHIPIGPSGAMTAPSVSSSLRAISLLDSPPDRMARLRFGTIALPPRPTPAWLARWNRQTQPHAPHWHPQLQRHSQYQLRRMNYGLRKSSVYRRILYS